MIFSICRQEGERNMVFYFTATGNSLYAAKQFEEKPVSIAQAIHDEQPVYQAEKIGIVCPVFGHEVPSLVKEFLERSVFQTPYFYMILTYGNRHGGAAELAESMLGNIGIHASYINVLLMVDSFLPAFDMSEQIQIDKKVDEHIRKIQEDIKNDRQYIAPVTEKDRAAHGNHATAGFWLFFIWPIMFCTKIYRMCMNVEIIICIYFRHMQVDISKFSLLPRLFH